MPITWYTRNRQPAVWAATPHLFRAFVEQAFSPNATHFARAGPASLVGLTPGLTPNGLTPLCGRLRRVAGHDGALRPIVSRRRSSRWEVPGSSHDPPHNAVVSSSELHHSSPKIMVVP